MVGVVGAAADKSMTKLMADIKENFEPKEIMMADLSPVIGTHTGPGTVGVAYVAGVDPLCWKINPPNFKCYPDDQTALTGSLYFNFPETGN